MSGQYNEGIKVHVSIMRELLSLKLQENCQDNVSIIFKKIYVMIVLHKVWTKKLISPIELKFSEMNQCLLALLLNHFEALICFGLREKGP